MREVYIVGAVRSPIGRRKGGLSGMHPADLLGAVQRAAVERSGVKPGDVGQIIGGCVSQVGEQSFNIARVAWLGQGFPMEVAATTVDSQCGSSQQATSLAAGMIGAGIEDLVLACGVEMMTRVPLGTNMKGGSPISPGYMEHYEATSQFHGAERIAKEYGITREDTDRFGLESQQKAIKAWAENRFEREIVPVTAPVLDAEGKETGEKRVVSKDEGLRESSLEKLATLNPVMPGGIHTAGSSSQVSDGASAVLLASPEKVKELGLKPRARIVATTLVGVDPETMLKGPIPATEKVLKQAGLTIDQIDEFEVNEAFASVPLAWLQYTKADPAKLNVNGGAISLGHPLGASGTKLMTTLVHALHARGKRYGLQTMCEGGGQANVTIIERL